MQIKQLAQSVSLIGIDINMSIRCVRLLDCCKVKKKHKVIPYIIYHLDLHMIRHISYVYPQIRLLKLIYLYIVDVAKMSTNLDIRLSSLQHMEFTFHNSYIILGIVPKQSDFLDRAQLMSKLYTQTRLFCSSQTG